MEKREEGEKGETILLIASYRWLGIIQLYIQKKGKQAPDFLNIEQSRFKCFEPSTSSTQETSATHTCSNSIFRSS